MNIFTAQLNTDIQLALKLNTLCKDLDTKVFASLDDDVFERGNFIGAYRKENDWRQGWSTLH